MKLEVGMYIRGSYYQYKGKIGKIIKNYQNELEIAYKDRIIKTTVSSFINDNFDVNGKQYKASHNIIDLIEVGDYVNDKKVKSISISNKDEWCILFESEGEDWINSGDVIKTIVTKEQFEAMQYKVSEEVVE